MEKFFKFFYLNIFVSDCSDFDFNRESTYILITIIFNSQLQQHKFFKKVSFNEWFLRHSILLVKKKSIWSSKHTHQKRLKISFFFIIKLSLLSSSVLFWAGVKKKTYSNACEHTAMFDIITFLQLVALHELIRSWLWHFHITTVAIEFISLSLSPFIYQLFFSMYSILFLYSVWNHLHRSISIHFVLLLFLIH